MLFNFLQRNIYEEYFKLYHYKDDIYRLVYFNKRQKGWEDLEDKKNIVVDKIESERCSLSRSKRSIREICLCNNFRYFVTLTINSKNADRFSLTNCQDELKRLLHNYSRRFNYNKGCKFEYIFITEKHKNGAFHFHGLISDLLDTDIYFNNNGFISSHFFDNNLGFCSFSEIKDLLKCSNYITKYITKDCIKNENNQIYICSRGLARAGVYDLPARQKSMNFEITDKFWTFKNDFCKIKDFHFDDLEDKEKMFIFDSFSNLK